MNAAQALPDGAADQNRITLRTRILLDGRVAVEVEDTGSGIPPEIRGRLFDPFFTTKAVGEGMGLGLSICHNIVTQLGGEIAVETEPGKGSCFRVTLLPARAEAASRPPAAGADETPTPTKRARVLFVDDEPLVGKALQRLLRARHEVDVMTNGAEALARLLSGERYDVVFCDLMMPEVSGMELYERLLAQAPEQAARVVFITGGAFTARARGLLERVPNARLDKPVNLDALVRHIHARLDQAPAA